MKYKNKQTLLSLLLGICCLLQLGNLHVCASEYWPESPEVEPKSAIVMELSTGTILYEKNITDQHYPASITKIMTTLLALENADLNEVITFSDRAIDETRGGSGIARDYGEQMTMEQTLYGVMLASGNECAFAVAEHVGGTMEKFVEMMNEKAAELGCVNTHFSNPHGLQDENHYTCAYDMALIAQAAYANETFRIITGTARYTIPPTNKHEEQTDLQNHNEMLYPFRYNKYVYEGCTGGKTGYTTTANSTLVTFAERDGMTLVCVVMDSQAPAHWTDSRLLFDYAFDNFQMVNIVENESRYPSSENLKKGVLNNQEAFVNISETAAIVLPKTAEFADTKSEITVADAGSDVVGSIVYTYAGHPVGKADIKRTDTVVNEFQFGQAPDTAQTEIGEEEQQTDGTAEEAKKIHIVIDWKVILIVIGVLAVVIILGICLKKFIDNYYIIKHNREVRKRRKQQIKTMRSPRRRHRRRW